ncbi:type II toxin-antitoxin system HipA family toxin [Pararobbsia silviterrae]|uniref:Type II toxin-antitoxin system HipA family toxin n=1 Tax=Pararobbsia silviterrae TaxID=1792498 RepID=A0A494XUS0_9BURK|nr:type II toxin-antitoxin system HipA family toxin [Pararobbsia silviterrae]RKP51819.1 type II toxin-antitoxin system HipA family toxin [Pararobbsia silviterrae]
MGRRSHTRALGLWMNGIFVGTWSTQSHAVEALQYDNAWVTAEQGRPLSLSLPFTPGNEAHRGDVVRAYFENLLPDSKAIRERVARRFKTQSTDAFTLLAEIGRDCAGALQILPDGIAPTDVTTLHATPLSEAEVAQLLRDTVAPAQMGGHDGDFRISIAGAQEKTALLYFNDQWYRPHGATPTSHILKLPLGRVGNMKLDLSESVENEWLCSEILAAYGIPIARTAPVRFEDMKVLAVERFDRMWWDERNGARVLYRLPQEDMCQATGTPPHLKYEADGGPGVNRIMRLLETSQYAERDTRIFFQAQVLFWMLCATDGHAKNFSVFLRPGGAYELTPLYDVLSAYPLLGDGPHQIPRLRAKMAMAVRSKNAHWRMRDIQRRHWLSMGERHGVVTADGREARFVVDALAERTPEVVRIVRAKLPYDFPQGLADSILDGLQTAADKLAG